MSLATYEHAQDVLTAAIGFAKSGERVALAMVIATEGGSVRTPGALMAISQSGQTAGYLSGGCIDADVSLQAREALEAGDVRHLRYGRGSPFADIKLPCGGAIGILITPHAGIDALLAARDRLAARESVSLGIAPGGQIIVGLPRVSGEFFRTTYRPKLALRIAGRGADCLALARVALAAQIDVRLQLPDAADMRAARSVSMPGITTLSTPGTLPPTGDDTSTAFALMFHDSEWESPLLQQALAGPAFYIGAVGSRATHQRRCDALRASGTNSQNINRIHGPIGLVPSMRDASMLAISVLSEIVAAYHAVEAVHV